MIDLHGAVAQAVAELPDAETLVDARTVAKWLGVTDSNVYKLCKRGEIPAVRLASRWRFRPVEVRAWMDAVRA
jgi:excisionase family DNA binding protein